MANNPKNNIGTENGIVVPYINAYSNAFQKRFNKVVLVDLEDKRTPPAFLLPDNESSDTNKDTD